MTRFGGLAAVTSALVAIVMFVPVIVWAVGLTTPAIVSWPLPAAARVQPEPSVIVTVGPVAEPAVPVPTPAVVPAQPGEPAPASEAVGVGGTDIPAASPIVIVSPAFSTPVAVKLIVQVDRAEPVAGDATHATPVVSAVAALIVTFAGLAVAVSVLVATVRFVPVIVCAVGLTTPLIVSWPLPPAEREQPAPSVIVTVGPVAEPEVFTPTPLVVLPQPE